MTKHNDSYISLEEDKNSELEEVVISEEIANVEDSSVENFSELKDIADILVQIGEFLDKKTILNMSQSSKSFHEMFSPHLNSIYTDYLVKIKYPEDMYFLKRMVASHEEIDGFLMPICLSITLLILSGIPTLGFLAGSIVVSIINALPEPGGRGGRLPFSPTSYEAEKAFDGCLVGSAAWSALYVAVVILAICLEKLDAKATFRVLNAIEREHYAALKEFYDLPSISTSVTRKDREKIKNTIDEIKRDSDVKSAADFPKRAMSVHHLFAPGIPTVNDETSALLNRNR